MSRVYCSVVVPAPVEQIWGTVRDFNGMPQWHPTISDSRIEDGLPGDAVGCVRDFHLTDGRHLREQLLSLSDLDHCYAYTILESGLPVQHYLAELRLRRVTADEHTFVEWVGQFDVPNDEESATCDTVMTVFSDGLSALVERFG